ncbi:hypothetical protein [Streptacidiphilus sp. P02-A3a]|uniref:hypothetical protein n=1 Tax=Streptacidiphilus sp. P02-A3a TaxID=2704468 RepID=UPI0015FD8972|nr:hypothetical protein [Streptacidiphilus sp. P02-A3a]QMU70701.1 hypothetical protein GXP74_23340 [Streptacidiphilus sp. P02-A3a]
MTGSGKLLRNASTAAALCAAAVLLAACGSARAGTADSSAAAVAATRPASGPASLIPDDVVSIHVIAFLPPSGRGCCPGPTGPGRQLATVTDRSRVALVAHELNALGYGTGAVPCPPSNGSHLELDFYSAGHPKAPSATAVVSRVGCGGVLLSAPGRHFLVHQGSVLDTVSHDLGLTFRTR